ncbi:MAG: NfeD family protein [Treponema sp.]|nr:NfeD family protein [Candidatus Treponema merdequi]
MINFLPEAMPWIWVALLIICGIIEASTLSLTTIWAAIAAIPMIFISKTSLSLAWQLLIFVSLTLILLLATRPLAVKMIYSKKTKDVNSLVGEEVTVIKTITAHEKGQVKTSNGVTWNAKSSDGTEIAENSICKITDVQGNTLTVQIN